MRTDDSEPLVVVLERGGRRVELTAGPAAPAKGAVTDDTPCANAASSPYPGTHFSPVEQQIWNALGGDPLGGKGLARATGQTYGPVFRGVLANLVKRGVLGKETHGYVRAPVGQRAG
jgi:hypothetical protein